MYIPLNVGQHCGPLGLSLSGPCSVRRNIWNKKKMWTHG